MPEKMMAMQAPKNVILELRVTGCLFSQSNPYKLVFEGIETELIPEATTNPKFTKVLHLSVFDNNDKLEFSVVALVNGQEKVVSTSHIPVTFGSKEFEHYDHTLPAEGSITGIVKIAYKAVKLNALSLLRETASGNSVLGISINSGLVGEGVDDSSDYKDVKVKIRDQNGQILGSNKLSANKSSAFFQLEEHEVSQNIDYLTLVVSIDEEKTFDIPLCPGTSSMCVPYAPKIALLCTVQLLYRPRMLSGLLHEMTLAVLKKTGSNEKVGALKGADTRCLKRKNLLFLQFLLPDGTIETPMSEEVLAKAVHGVPLKRSGLQQLSDGFFMIIVDSQTGRSQKKKALLKKNLGLHLGTFSVSSEMLEEGVKIRCKCTMVSVSADIEGTDSLETICSGSAIMATGVLEEKEREVSRETGVVSVVIEGNLDVNDKEPKLKDFLEKQASTVSPRITLSIIPAQPPPLLSPTGELMPLSPPESPRLDEEPPSHGLTTSASRRNLNPDGQVAVDEQAAADEQVAVADGQAAAEEAPKEPTHDDLLGTVHENDTDNKEMDGQWRMQHQGQERPLYEGEDIANWGDPGGLGDEGSPVKYRIDKVSNDLVKMIKSELTEKQRIIERLLGEASARTDAIEICGREIRALRDEVLKSQNAAQEAETALAQRDAAIQEASRFVEQEVGSPEELSKLSRTTLVHVACDLGERLEKVTAEREELLELVAEAQSARHQMAEDKKNLAELQEAHVEQSKLIQKLQKKLAATDTYKSTIKLQERVIAKMQSVIEAHLRTTRRDPGEGAGLLDRILTDLEKRGAEEETSLAQAHQDEAEAERRKKAEEALKAEKKAVETLQRKVERLESELKDAMEVK